MVNFKSFLVLLILLIGYYNCASVDITAFKSNDYVDFQCYFPLNSTALEKLDKLEISKDDQKPFYWINNKTEINNNLTGIKLIGPGHFKFPIVNKTTSGSYKCLLVYIDKANKSQTLDKKLTVTVDKTVDLKATFSVSKAINTDKSNSSLIFIQCSTNITKSNQTFVELSLTKDSHVFVKMDKHSNIFWSKINGTEVGTNVTKKPEIPSLSFNMNTTKESKGKYQCWINYTTIVPIVETIDTRIISDEVQWNSAETHFINHLFLYLALFIFNFTLN